MWDIWDTTECAYFHLGARMVNCYLIQAARVPVLLWIQCKAVWAHVIIYRFMDLLIIIKLSRFIKKNFLKSCIYSQLSNLIAHALGNGCSVCIIAPRCNVATNRTLGGTAKYIWTICSYIKRKHKGPVLGFGVLGCFRYRLSLSSIETSYIYLSIYLSRLSMGNHLQTGAVVPILLFWEHIALTRNRFDWFLSTDCFTKGLCFLRTD